MDMMIKNMKLVEIIFTINTNVYVETGNPKKSLIKNLKKKFVNRCKFCNHDNCKFILLLQKDVYPYDCIHVCKNSINIIT